jgi:5-enolpyruvylshikimate-3-phosphate synthase
MLSPRKPYLTLTDLALALHREAKFAEARADLLGRAALRVEQEGDTARVAAMRTTCRKMGVQALLDRCRAVAAETKEGGKP